MPIPRSNPQHWLIFAVTVILMLVSALSARAQVSAEPQREQLLNGLRILIWPKPETQDVLLKLRIHSGAAFDLSGKSGEISLLGDILFPDPATLDFFTDEMGGKLAVDVNYDSVTITMIGKAVQFEQIVEVLRNGVLQTQLTPEVVARVRDARIKILRDTAVSPPVVADRAIARRLFGEFPYSRSTQGSPEDVARVERADLMLARDRFLNSNNATLAVVGGVTKVRAMRTVRQLLGPWRKSEQIVPTTFRQPITPDVRTLIVSGPNQNAELRLAVRGVSRSDNDFYASEVMAKVAQNRWKAADPELSNKPAFVRSEARVLPGILIMGASVSSATAADSIASAKKALDSLISTPATGAELERAKSEVVADLSGPMTKAEALPDPWLDLDTYRLASLQSPVTSVQAVTPADLQRVATRLLKDQLMATVIVGDPVQLKPALQGRVQFEVLGEIAPPATTPKPAAKPGSETTPG
jgi:zinc protease